jgi:alkylated DNA repair dioxygenase AlkB
MKAEQAQLFDAPPALPHGLVYQPDFVTREEEEALLAVFAGLPFQEALFQQYTARRRVVRYGEGEYPASYGAEAEERNPRRAISRFPAAAADPGGRVAGQPEAAFVHALVTEYRPGTPIGWHSDAPHFERVVGHLAGRRGADALSTLRGEERSQRGRSRSELAPRSAYAMEGDIRWRWQHHIPPTRELRYSITFRTLRAGCEARVASPSNSCKRSGSKNARRSARRIEPLVAFTTCLVAAAFDERVAKAGAADFDPRPCPDPLGRHTPHRPRSLQPSPSSVPAPSAAITARSSPAPGSTSRSLARPAHVAAIERAGLCVLEAGGEWRARLRASTDSKVACAAGSLARDR